MEAIIQGQTVKISSACKICGRELTNPASIARGMGEICAGSHNHNGGAKTEESLLLFDEEDYNELIKPLMIQEMAKKQHTLEFEDGYYYLDGNLLTPEQSRKYRNHSPDGFNHGYGGSGPAQLALAVVLKCTGKPDGYQDFKFKYIAAAPQGKEFKIEFEL